MKKRILSCFMALALCLTLLPATAQAAEGESSTEPHTHSNWLTSGYGSGSALTLYYDEADNISGYPVDQNDGNWLLNGGNYYLRTDVENYKAFSVVKINHTIVIKGNVTICLNGQTIESSAKDQPVFEVTSGSTLTLTDCQNNKGKVTHASDGSGCGVKVESGGIFNMYGGTISGNTATKGGGVYVSGGNSKFNMYGGTITDNTAPNGGGVYVSGGTFTMNGNASVTSNEATDQDNGTGGGVYVVDGIFTMDGGTITKNTASSTDGGVGVYTSTSTATFTMNGGTISGNTATKGGGVGVYRAAKFKMNGSASITDNTANQGGGVHVKGAFTMNNSASVTGNTATTNGGGVYVEGGTFTMNDGTIGGTTDGDANKANQDGGGVYASSGTFTMSGGRITGNHNNGVFVSDHATFTVSGAPTVMGNTREGAVSNVFLAGSKTITIGNKLNKGASIGVTKTAYSLIAENVSTDYSGKFFSDDKTREVKYDTDNKQLVLKNKETQPPEHRHEWTYTADKATITATCTGVGNCDVNNSFVWITPPDDLIYNGTEKHATVERSENWKPAFPENIVISYYKLAGGSYVKMVDEAPTKVGKYKASITVGDKDASVEYEILASTTEIVPVSQITLDKTSISISVGNSEKLTATVTPENAANKRVTWTSSNENVATVDANGTVKALAVGTTTITATAEGDPSKSATCTVTVTGGTTTGGNTGGSTGGNTGGSSSSGGSSSGGSGSYDSNPIIKTETKNNADGSTTKTETRKDGSVTQTTTGKDGSVSKTETKKDGSSVTENKAADGSTGTVKTDKHGQTEAKTALSNKAVEDAKKNGEAVKAPVEVKASRNSGTAPTVKVELPGNAGKTEVEIPVSNANAGTVAVLVHPDGTEEILKNSIPTEDGIQLTVDGNATVKIIDNSKDFIDTRNHWAREEIDFVSARELVNGMSATIYAPNASATRAQLWTILARQNDANLNGGATWFEKAQNGAKTKGVSDGANPNAAINRAQMVTMLWRTMGQPTATDKVSFADVPAGSYYAQAVAWAVENGITTGVGGGRFDPAATCTRAQIAAFLTRLYAEK